MAQPFENLVGWLVGVKTDLAESTTTFSPSYQYDLQKEYQYHEAWQYAYNPVLVFQSPEAVVTPSITKKDTATLAQRQDMQASQAPETTGKYAPTTKENLMGALMPYLIAGGLVVAGIYLIKK